jgi:RNA polymerase sigma-70 factor (ECF subfamily)
MRTDSADLPERRENPRRLDLPTSLSLLVRLRGQDQEGWREFLTLYTPLVVRWCSRRGVPEHDVADVAQNVFSRVMFAIQQFRKNEPEDSLRGWLCRITHQQIALYFRQRALLPSAAGGTGALLQLQQQADPRAEEPPAEEARQETGYLYRKVIEIARLEFSGSTWSMFWRTAVDGNPATDVAAELGTTPACVRQAKSRVLRRLRQLVGDIHD